MSRTIHCIDLAQGSFEHALNSNSSDMATSRTTCALIICYISIIEQINCPCDASREEGRPALAIEL
jgi:hypothetical protein